MCLEYLELQVTALILRSSVYAGALLACSVIARVPVLPFS